MNEHLLTLRICPSDATFRIQSKHSTRSQLGHQSELLRVMSSFLCSVGKLLDKVGAGQKLLLSVLLRTDIGTKGVSIATSTSQEYLHAAHDCLNGDAVSFEFLVAGRDNPLLS